MAGHTIGPFEILAELGRGGMGTVYHARDLRHGREVALKLLTQGHLANPRQRERFEREARAVAKLAHPNVVRLLDVGELNGAPYLALDYHPGGNLQDRIDRGPLEPEEVVELGAQIADALAAVHAQGILHRDLKPDNVLIDAVGAPQLTDFGLANDHMGSSTRRLTQTGAFLGTPGFWSPEQAAGDLERVGPRSDLYSLGALLFAALTCRPPVEGVSFLEVQQATLDQPPPPLRKLRPEVSRELEVIVARCLAKDPDDRWPSAAEVAAALRACAPRAAPPRPLPLLPLALGGLVLGGAIGAGWALATRSPPSAPAPPPAQASATPRPEPTSPAKPDVAALLREGKAAVKAKRYDEAREPLERAAAAGSAEAQGMLGDLYSRGLGVPESASQAVAWYRRAADAGNARAMNNLASHYLEGRGIEPSAEQGVAWYRRAAHAGNHMAMTNLGLLYLGGRAVAKSRSEARSWFARAAEGEFAPAMHQLALLYEGEQDFARAVDWYRRAAQGDHAAAMVNLGRCYWRGRGVTQDSVEGTRWARKAADLGSRLGRFNYALALRDGRGVTQDQRRAYALFKRLADEGDGDAMRLVGRMLLVGAGVDKDERAAARWIERAAKLGKPQSQFVWGRLLQKGRGVKQDLRQAVVWYRRAAKQGSAEAMINLGLLLQRKVAPEREPGEARRWLQQALESPRASPEVRRLARQMLGS